MLKRVPRWQSLSRPEFERPRWGRDSELDPCLQRSVGVKGTESGAKGCSIRRPFHPDDYFLRLVA
jgi:hypothetical protein